MPEKKKPDDATREILDQLLAIVDEVTHGDLALFNIDVKRTHMRMDDAKDNEIGEVVEVRVHGQRGFPE